MADDSTDNLTAVCDFCDCDVKTMCLCLRLSECTESSCVSLASALRSNTSQVRDLELMKSHPGETGRRLLSELQNDPEYNLQTLTVQTS